MRRADIYECRSPTLLDDVRGCETRPDILGIDGADAVSMPRDDGPNRIRLKSRRLGHER